MLKKVPNSRSTRSGNTSTSSSTQPTNATVLKPIYPAALPSNNYKKIETSDENSAFLLPSSEFFVVDKDSILLSESDIFQTNLARRISANTTDPSSTIIFDCDDEEDEKENQMKKNSAVNEVYTGLLHSLPPQPKANNLNNKKQPVQLRASSGTSSQSHPIAPLKSISTPVTSNSLNHVPTSQGEKEKQQLDKGLRHFSAKVCAKVEEKGVTTYNEVADDLVQEIGLEMGKCDHKNIRRRVYDALNVLMAIDIICKEKKEIRWLGLPNEAAEDLRALENERLALQERIAEKNRNLREILRRCISLKNLIDRNATEQKHQQGDKLSLPFILISAARDCHVHCEMLEDRTQYFFEFNTAFQINEDIELMRLMGLDTGRIERIKSFFPKELVAQVLMLCLNNNNNTNNPANLNNSLPTSNPNFPSNSDSAMNSSVFAPILNNEDLNLGDLESFNSSSSSSL